MDALEDFKEHITHVFNNLPTHRPRTDVEKNNYDYCVREVDRLRECPGPSTESIMTTEKLLKYYEDIINQYPPEVPLSIDEINDYLHKEIGAPFCTKLRSVIEYRTQELFLPHRRSHETKLKEMEEKYNQLERLEEENRTRLTHLHHESEKVKEKLFILRETIRSYKLKELDVSPDVLEELSGCEAKDEALKSDRSKLHNRVVERWNLAGDIARYKKQLTLEKIVTFIQQEHPDAYQLALKEWFDLGDYIVELYNSLPNRSSNKVKYYSKDRTLRLNATFKLEFNRRSADPKLKLKVDGSWSTGQVNQSNSTYDGVKSVSWV